MVYNDSVSFSKVFHTQLNDLFFLLRKVKFLLSLTYLLFYLLPLVPSKHYRIVLRPRPLKDESKAPNCYKGPDKMLKIVLVPKNSSGPSQAVEQALCGVDGTVDEERLLSENQTLDEFFLNIYNFLNGDM